VGPGCSEASARTEANTDGLPVSVGLGRLEQQGFIRPEPVSAQAAEVDSFSFFFSSFFHSSFIILLSFLLIFFPYFTYLNSNFYKVLIFKFTIKCITKKSAWYT
jgi:hypothetical protein